MSDKFMDAYGKWDTISQMIFAVIVIIAVIVTLILCGLWLTGLFQNLFHYCAIWRRGWPEEKKSQRTPTQALAELHPGRTVAGQVDVAGMLLAFGASQTSPPLVEGFMPPETQRLIDRLPNHNGRQEDTDTNVVITDVSKPRAARKTKTRLASVENNGHDPSSIEAVTAK